jgi:hypothetical protein
VAQHVISAFTRVFDTLVSAFTRVFDTLWAVYRKAWTQNRENNPMQSRMGPRLAALVLRCVRGPLQPFVLPASDASVFI